MRLNRWKLIMTPVAMLGLAAPLLMNCGGGGGGGPLGGLPDVPGAPGECKGLETGDFSSLQADAKIKGMLEAAANFDKLAAELEADAIAACAALGTELGLPEGQLKAEPNGGKGAENVCGFVAGEVKAKMSAQGNAQLKVDYKEPTCYADVKAMQDCLGGCGAAVQGGDLQASCQGGKISGQCKGECKGSCKLDAGAQCTGTCNGTCSGKCESNFSGKCGGTCKGTCDGKNTKGKCAGKCEGTCEAQAEGSCGGTCEGTCSASCEVKAQGECKGTCEGGCSGEVEAPKCSGEFKPPQVDAQCHSQCAAKTAGEVKCEPPRVNVSGAAQGNAEAEKLAAAIAKALPAIVEIQLGTGQRVLDAGQALVASLEGAASSAGSLGLEAAACVAGAAKATASASAQVNVSVKASASASASASGGT